MAKGSKSELSLDNPVWHALNGPLSRFAASHSSKESSKESSEKSPKELVHFDPEVNVFSGVDRIDEAMWLRVAELVGVEGHCGFFRDAIPTPPSGWEVLFRGVCQQMLVGDLPPLPERDFVALGRKDAAEMLALAELTEPGPYLLRTSELGRYVGIKRDGRLLAMAGERFRVRGFVEISAVCTHPDARGEGLARDLTLNVAHSIRASGNDVFLHVLDDNENAIRLYHKLGFSTRRKVDVVFAQWHGTDWKSEDAGTSQLRHFKVKK